MGCRDIEACQETALLQRGEYKIHLLESSLPDFDELCREIGEVHACDRAVAVHCVSLTELVFALAALDCAGTLTGDRIEHASVTSPEQLRTLREMALRVVTQPHFVAERGDQYVAEVAAEEHPWLYRCAAFLASGIPLAGGSDAPFGSADPWRAMRAATERTTPAGTRLSQSERLTPEQALSLYLSRPEAPGTEQRRLAPGAPADLCLLGSPWRIVRRDLDSRHVRMTWRGGGLLFCAD
jgi:predicted amidohydrolase YtcJ